MARAPRLQTRINRLLDEDAALPADQRMPNAERIKLIEILSKNPARRGGGAKKGNRPPNTGKIKKPSRNFTQADIERLRGNDKPKPAPTESTLGDFLNTIEEKPNATE